MPWVDRCLYLLGEERVWWRPNGVSNSAGNIVVHMCGNLRQWVISTLGGLPDTRVREEEFAPSLCMSVEELRQYLHSTVQEAVEVLLRYRITGRKYAVQGFVMSDLQIILHALEHFAYHTGQVVWITKMLTGTDLQLWGADPACPKPAWKHRPGATGF